MLKMKDLKRIKKNITLHPLMTFLILIIITIVASGLLSLMNVQTTYNSVNNATNEIEIVDVTITSLFSLAGLKYIFSNTVSNFVNFAPLSSLIIILIGIGIMEKSGLLKTFFTLITKYSSKNKVTFFLILFCLISSIGGDLTYVVILPLAALLFKYGKRNPVLGIIASFGALSCGTGLNIFINSIDSSLLTYSNNAALLLDGNYHLGVHSFIFIMLVVTIVMAFVLTAVTEKFIAPRLPKPEYKEEDNANITRRKLKGLVIGLGAGIIYLLFFIYNIIPGLPLSGNLLDYSELNYIDKLFGYNSFFNSGFVFVVTIFFIIMGIFYGLGAKTVKNNRDVCEYFGHSLDGIGSTLVFILFSSVLISVFKKTNMGTFLVALLTNLIGESGMSGIILILSLFLITIVSNIFLPSSIYKWSVMAGTIVPTFMNAGLSPEFAQVIFRAGECVSTCITPLFAYLVIYLGILHQYDDRDRKITLMKSIRYMLPYAGITFCVWIVVIIIWFFTGLPLGIGSSMFI